MLGSATAAANEIKQLVEEYKEADVSKDDLIDIVENRCDQIIEASNDGYY